LTIVLSVLWYGFWLPLWYLLTIVLSVLWYGFWLPLWYLLTIVLSVLCYGFWLPLLVSNSNFLHGRHIYWPNITGFTRLCWLINIWSWLYGSWIYNYLCNQCLPPLKLWIWISIRARCITLCGKVCQWLAAGRWFSPGTVSSTNKTYLRDITEILLKVALNTIKQWNKQTVIDAMHFTVGSSCLCLNIYWRKTSVSCWLVTITQSCQCRTKCIILVNILYIVHCCT
jgi:hypothetical protein